MSSVNYSLKHKGVRLVDPDKVWLCSKNGKARLNPKYKFVGRVEIAMPNMVFSTLSKKPSYSGDVHEFNRIAKKQLVSHFFNDNGKRTRKSVAYFGIEKTKK